MHPTLRREWFGNTRNDLLSGLVVALALIPEAIAFSAIVGVEPRVGLFASFAIAVVTAFLGGRPGMISAATGAMALVLASVFKEHGLGHVLAVSVMAGVLQIGVGVAGFARLMRFVSKSVMTGFVNALAILIFMAQLPELTNVSWVVYAMVAAGLGIIYGFPRITKAVPSPLVAIAVLTAASLALHLDVRTVGDMGALPDNLPALAIPTIPWTLDTFLLLLPTAVTLAMVGLLESMMTASIVDDMTDTTSHKTRECVAQGVGNIVAGFLGGMAGCAMIGQSVINVKSGGRGRLSSLCAGVFLLLLVVFGSPLVSRIPMAALVAVMIMVSVGTFSWGSLRNLRRLPRSSSVVTFSTVLVVVGTHDLARGVLVGVLLSGFFFAAKVGRLLSVGTSLSDDGGTRHYVVVGQVFFASAERFINAFSFDDVPGDVVIDVSAAHLWDVTAVAALDKVVLKLRRAGATVRVLGLNEASATLVDRFGLHDKRPDIDLVPGH